VPASGQEQGVAIRFGSRHGAGGDGPTRTRLRLHHNGLPESFGDFVANQAGDIVSISARGKALQDLDGPLWPSLAARQGTKSSATCGSSAEKKSTLHDLSPQNEWAVSKRWTLTRRSIVALLVRG
jgi:hypothetical protein